MHYNSKNPLIRYSVPTEDERQSYQDTEDRMEERRRGWEDDKCPRCDGFGEIYDDADYLKPHKECDHCHGTGWRP